VLFTAGQLNLALSPDGESLVNQRSRWRKFLRSGWSTIRHPMPVFPYRLHARKQDLSTFSGNDLASQYVLINLRSGTVRSLSDGPLGLCGRLGRWWSACVVDWTGAGWFLPDLFVASRSAGPARRVCGGPDGERTGPVLRGTHQGPLTTRASYEKLRATSLESTLRMSAEKRFA